MNFTKLIGDDRGVCARQMNPSKTSEHKDTNQWEEKAGPREIQMKISEKSKRHHPQYETVNAKEEMKWIKLIKARETTSNGEMPSIDIISFLPLNVFKFWLFIFFSLSYFGY